MKAAVFLERDGVFTVPGSSPGGATPLTLEKFRINRKASAPLKRLKEAGFLIIVTTHQPGLSSGELCRRDMDQIHDQLYRLFPVDDIFVCPHGEGDECPCRKPQPGLLIEAGFKWRLDLDRSFVVSDKWQDAQAAHVAGCTSVMLQSPWLAGAHHDFIAEHLEAAVEKILQLTPHGGSVTEDPRAASVV